MQQPNETVKRVADPTPSVTADARPIEKTQQTIIVVSKDVEPKKVSPATQMETVGDNSTIMAQSKAVPLIQEKIVRYERVTSSNRDRNDGTVISSAQ